MKSVIHTEIKHRYKTHLGPMQQLKMEVKFFSLLVTLNDSPWTPLISGHSARLMSLLAFESEVLALDVPISSAFPV